MTTNETNEDTTMSELAKVTAAYERATELAVAARAKRDELIRAADVAGHARSEIARTAKVTREIVYRVLAVLVAFAAILTLGACGSSPDQPTDAPQSPVSTSEASPVAQGQDSTPEPSATCWSDPSGDPYAWRAVANEINSDPVRLVEFLESLPEASEGCTEADRAALAASDVSAAATRADFPDLFTD